MTFGRDAPAVLGVEREVVRSGSWRSARRPAFRSVEVAEQEVGERRAAALRRRQQRILRVAAVEREAAARHDAADLVVEHVAQLAAELERVLAHGPREVVDELESSCRR